MITIGKGTYVFIRAGFGKINDKLYKKEFPLYDPDFNCCGKCTIMPENNLMINITIDRSVDLDTNAYFTIEPRVYTVEGEEIIDIKYFMFITENTSKIFTPIPMKNF